MSRVQLRVSNIYAVHQTSLVGPGPLKAGRWGKALIGINSKVARVLAVQNVQIPLS